MVDGAEVYAWGAFVVARFSRSAVVVNRRWGSIFELGQAAAVAVDLLTDRAERPHGEVDGLGTNLVELLPRVQRELLGQRELAPGEGITLEGVTGEPLLRRQAEPAHWRGPAGGVSRALAAGRMALSGTILRVGTGVVAVLAGRRRDARDLAGLGADSDLGDVHELDAVNLETFGLRSDDGQASAVGEVWSLGDRATDNVVLSRLGYAASLLALLEATRFRPTMEDFRVLARVCVTLPHFRATMPRGGIVLAETLRRFRAR